MEGNGIIPLCPTRDVELARRQPRLCRQGIRFLGGGLMTWAMQLWNVEGKANSVASGCQGTKEP